MTKLLVMDLDDTMCYTGHVSKDEMYGMNLRELLPDFSVIEKVKAVAKREGCKVVILTARNTDFRAETYGWVKEYMQNVPFMRNKVLMQDPQTMYSVPEYKERQLLDLMEEGNEIFAFVDDDDKNLKKVSHLGFKTLTPKQFMQA